MRSCINGFNNAFIIVALMVLCTDALNDLLMYLYFKVMNYNCKFVISSNGSTQDNIEMEYYNV